MVSRHFLNQVIELSQQLCQFYLATALIHLIHIFSPSHKTSVGFLSINPFCRSHPLLRDIIKSIFLQFYLWMYKQYFCLWITLFPSNSAYVFTDVNWIVKLDFAEETVLLKKSACVSTEYVSDRAQLDYFSHSFLLFWLKFQCAILGQYIRFDNAKLQAQNYYKQVCGIKLHHVHTYICRMPASNRLDLSSGEKNKFPWNWIQCEFLLLDDFFINL